MTINDVNLPTLNIEFDVPRSTYTSGAHMGYMVSSIAVSLKRIADTLESIDRRLETLNTKVESHDERS